MSSSSNKSGIQEAKSLLKNALRLSRRYLVTDKSTANDVILRGLSRLSFADQVRTARNADIYNYQLKKVSSDISCGIYRSFNEVCVRRNDTVYILGSGPSINDITDSQWSSVKSSDSWGFNFWMLHDFVPTAYFHQLFKIESSAHRHDLMKSWHSIWRMRSESYKDVQHVIKGGAFHHGYSPAETEAFQAINSRSSNLTAVPVLLIPPGMTASVADQLNAFYPEGNIALRNPSRSLSSIQFRSTVALLVLLAAQMGYRKIVLCGIDALGPGHFYSGDEYRERFPDVGFLVKYAASLGTVHPHAVKSQGMDSAIDQLVELCKWVRQTCGTEVESMSANSRLVGLLPLHEG